MMPALTKIGPFREATHQRRLVRGLGATLVGATVVLLVLETRLFPGALLAAYTRSKLVEPAQHPIPPWTRRYTDLLRPKPPLQREVEPPQDIPPTAEELRRADQDVRKRIHEMLLAADALFAWTPTGDRDAAKWRIVRSYRGFSASDADEFRRRFLAVTAIDKVARDPNAATANESSERTAMRTIRAIDAVLDDIDRRLRETRP